MDCGFGLTFKDSLQIWWHFAKQSRRCGFALSLLLVMYSTVAIFSTPLFLLWLAYYFSLTFVFKKRTSLQIDGLPINKPFSSIIWFLIVIEPRLRAIDIIDMVSSANLRGAKYKGMSYVKLLVKARLVGWLFYNVTSIPFVYVKHINLWISLLHNNMPGSFDEFSAIAAEYLLQNFG